MLGYYSDGRSSWVAVCWSKNNNYIHSGRQA